MDNKGIALEGISSFLEGGVSFSNQVVRVENTKKGMSPFYSACNKGGSFSFNYLAGTPN